MENSIPTKLSPEAVQGKTEKAKKEPKPKPEPKPLRLRNKGWTEEEVRKMRESLTVNEVPEGWIKISDLHKICVKEGIQISRMVKAIGGDRGMEPVLNPDFKIIYSGRNRWISPKAATKESLNLLRGMGRKAMSDEEKAAKAAAKKEAQVKALDGNKVGAPKITVNVPKKA